MSHGVLIHLMVSHGVLCLMETQYLSWRLTVCSDVSWCLMSQEVLICLMVSHCVLGCSLVVFHCDESWCLRISRRVSCCLTLSYDVSWSLRVSHGVL